MVVMNAATSIITLKSPYIARTSTTTPQLNQTFGTWAAKHGIKTAYTMVSDYGPGIDAEGAFHLGFKEGGGEIVGSVRFPVANPDFSAFVQRAKDSNPDAIYIWIPGGAQPAAVGKALAERGIDPSKVKGDGPGLAHLRKRAQEHGRCGARHHHGLRLRLQYRLGRSTMNS
jgi:branched-chain amino acid transport system substrate-binding protein